MKHIRSVLVMLAASMILNLLVAWGCVLWCPYKHYVSPKEKSDYSMPDEIFGPDHTLGWWITSAGFGVFESAPHVASVSEDEDHFKGWGGSVTPACYRCGWPMFSMQSLIEACKDSQGGGLVRWQLPRAEILHRGLQTGTLPSWLHAQKERRLPIFPIWFGFIINTLLYIGAMFGISFLWQKLRILAPNKSPEPISVTASAASQRWLDFLM